MKRPLLFFICFIGTLCIAAQCTPDPLYADSVFGVWPDTTTNFPPAILNDPYLAQIDVIVPASSNDIPGQTPNIDIDSAQVLDVAGLPPGITFDCASQTAATCTYLPEVLGCGVLTGVPTTVGEYPLTLVVRAWFTFFGAQSVDTDFSGYSVVVSDIPNSLGENERSVSLIHNIPNPFSVSTRIDYRLTEYAEVDFRVLDMLGKQVYFEKRQGFSGRNSFSYAPQDLEEGVYLYSLTTPSGQVTQRMVYRPDR